MLQRSIFFYMELILINKDEIFLEVLICLNSKLYDSNVIPFELIKKAEKRIIDESL